MIVFGPVPSRRLGRSLGINNIPPKTCSYACAYCQLGRTTHLRTRRTSFYGTWEILQAAQERVTEAARRGEPIDYLSFVPDGEPTLDINLGRAVDAVKQLGVPVAVIGNASLLWSPDVREDLMRADCVSVKVDATREDEWRRINRPHGSLRLSAILEGVREFCAYYRGRLLTETMLLAGVNDSESHVQEIADFVARLKPARAYLTPPIRPPAEKWARPPEEAVIVRAYEAFRDRVGGVECLADYEGDAFSSLGAVEDDLLSIMSVHPMREDAARQFLKKAGADTGVIRSLVSRGQLVETEYRGHRYYVRKLSALSRTP